MGHITTKYINTLSKNTPSVFIETGTFKGGIPQRMLEDGSFGQWTKIYTIELNLEMCKIASKRYSLFEKGETFDFNTDEKDETFNGRKEFFGGKLVLIQGDSSEKLKEVLDEVNEPCVFWLDAHAGAKEGYARGEVDCPLLQELDTIKNHKIKEHIITVDDADIFGQVQYKNNTIVCDYSDITPERIETILNSINSKYSVNYPIPFGQKMLTAVNTLEEVKTQSGWWIK